MSDNKIKEQVVENRTTINLVNQKIDTLISTVDNIRDNHLAHLAQDVKDVGLRIYKQKSDCNDKFADGKEFKDLRKGIVYTILGGILGMLVINYLT